MDPRPNFSVSASSKENRLTKTKLSIALAIALTLSACAEKAKTWTGAQLQKFKEKPNIEMLDEKGVDQIVNTIHDFDLYVKNAGDNYIDLRDKDRAQFFDQDPTLVDKSGKRYPYRYNAILLDNNSVLVENVNPWIEKVGEGSSSVMMHDTIYKVVKDPKTDRYTIIIKQGNSLREDEQDGTKPPRETGIDRDTGVIMYVTGGPALDEDFELDLDNNGNLQPKTGSTYETGLGQIIAGVGVTDMTELSKKIDHGKH